MRHEICIAMRAFMQRLQPGQIILSVSGTNGVLAGERWIAHDCVEAAVLTRKHLWKFHLPMERRNGMRADPQFLGEWGDSINPIA
jgi:hypothetical protein